MQPCTHVPMHPRTHVPMYKPPLSGLPAPLETALRSLSTPPLPAHLWPVHNRRAPQVSVPRTGHPPPGALP
eukprot:358032-Chlamydomonas_euryale.AAC.8